ncbi:DUF547 domain-containing protein [Aquimarina litoralis]|uniref:DUF547 domain-containing protein n=1 Tax=Aquimarina litoralis TaxID=584605 RepID=UPI001C58C18C|nr:DUF547 domain-containing protein [Aquimarina litoralis]MBW1296881.1 DUF547 domain-containing protein [Aquimarina litoralis]
MKIALQFLLLSIIYGCNSSSQEKKINSKENVDTLAVNQIIDEQKQDQKIIDTAITDTFSIKKDTLEGKIVDSIQDDITSTSEKKEIIVSKKPKEKKDKKVQKIRPNHTIWDQLTKKYVSSTGKVNYKGFKSNISKIDQYLAHLQKVYPKKGWTKNEKLAYWFNLYNAATIRLVANTYPVKSIKDINSGKPWDKKFIKSGSKVYSLNQIENTIVRPNYNEPRLHVAFNCAAVSCPKLLKGAFFPSKLNYQLEKLSKNWINDTSKNKIQSDKVVISKIFEWYAVDFKKGVIPFINTYATTKAKESAKIQYLEYNWNLND